MKKNNKLMIILICAAGLIFVHGARLLLPPLLFSIRSEFNLNAFQGSMLMTSFLIFYAIMQGVLGYLIPAIGRKKLIIIGVILYTGTTFLMGAATNQWQLLVFQIIGALGAGTYYIPSLFIVNSQADIYKRGQARSIFNIGSTFGAMLASMCTGLALKWWTWRMAYKYWSLLGVIVIILLYIFLPDDNHLTYSQASDNQKPSHNFRKYIFAAPYLILTACLVINSIREWGFRTFLPEYLTIERGFSQVASATLYSMTLLISIVGFLLAGWLSDRKWNIFTIVRLSFGLGSIGLPVILLFQNRTLLIIALLGYSAVGSMIFLALISSLIVLLPDNLIEKGTGIANGVSFIGAAIGPALMGAVIDIQGFALALIILSIITFIGFGLVLLLKNNYLEEEVKAKM